MQVWGRFELGDELHSGVAFRQKDIEAVVQITDHRWDAAISFPLCAGYGQAILNLCVSDTNKQLLLNVEGFLAVLVDSLLLDPEHPRREQPNFETIKAGVQAVRDASCSAIPGALPHVDFLL